MTESPHPTDEQLSAAIDGVNHDAEAHAASCDRCSYRLSAMRGVAAAIGEPPTVDEVLRERVLGAALQHDVDAVGGGGNRSTSPLVWIAGAAAALLIAVLALPALFGGDDGDGQTTAARDELAEFGSGEASSAANNLGSFRDERELAAVVGPLIGDNTGGGQADAAAPTTLAPAAGGGRAASGPSKSGADAQCAAVVAGEYGQGLGPFVYAGVLVWQDTPAVLLAYEIDGATGPLDHRVFVMAESDCTLLTVLSI